MARTAQTVSLDWFKWVVTGLLTVIVAGIGWLITDFKNEYHDLRKEFSDTQKELAKGISDTRVQIAKEIADTRVQIAKEISETRVQVTQAINAVQTQAATTNAKLEDLLAAEARRRGR